jgi:hypothetical protein
MQRAKHIAAVSAGALLFLAATAVAANHCGWWQTLLPDHHFNRFWVWAVPPVLVLFLHPLLYDALSLLTYRFGYEARFNDLPLYPEDSTTPAPRWQKVIAYPFILFIIAAFMAGWSKVVYCP